MKTNRVLVMGDVHGGFKAMKHVLEVANFDYNNDTLICLGDVVDGWSESKEVIDELLKITNLIYLLGNHDEWALEYYSGEFVINGKVVINENWFYQGGKETIDSLGDYYTQDPKYLEFLKTGKFYHTIEKEDGLLIFAHANIPNRMFNMDKLVMTGKSEEFIWERYLIQEAARMRNTWKTVDTRFKEIYLGHSGVGYLMPIEEHQWKPQKMTNVWAMDTNAAYSGKVSLLDIDTKELFQSDFVCRYYPNERGRNGESYNEYLKRQQ